VTTRERERDIPRTDEPRRDEPRTDGPRTGDRPTRRWSRGRNRRSDFSAKVEKAAERAAEATRTAAAVAAAERSHAKPRTSGLASLSLVVSVVAALAVATGALAGLGAGVGILGLLLGLAGLAATGRRYYLAGRFEATAAVLLSLGAIVVGVLAVTGELSWLDTGTDQVARLRDWLPSWLT
jgi:hypothetical protein